MTNPQDIESRLTDLEVKATFTEDLVDSLNQVIVRQQQDIDLLLRQLAQLSSDRRSMIGHVAENIEDALDWIDRQQSKYCFFSFSYFFNLDTD